MSYSPCKCQAPERHWSARLQQQSTIHNRKSAMVSLFRDCLIEIENQAGNIGVGREFTGIETHVPRVLALVEKLGGSLCVRFIAFQKSMERVVKKLALFRSGRTRRGETKSIADAFFRFRSSLLHHPLCKHSRGFQVSRIIHEVQCLERGVRPRNSHGTGLTVGGIKGRHGRRRDSPFPVGVKASAILLFSLVRLIGSSIESDLFPQSRRLVGFYRRAPDLLYQQTGNRQCLIANRLGGQAESRSASQETVFGILFKQLGSYL